jgi:hypothetical protein
MSSTTTAVPTKRKPATTTKRRRRRPTTQPAAPAPAKSKRKRTSAEQDTLAAMANGKAKPAARISGSNIKRVQGKLGGKKPSVHLGIPSNMIAQLATGSKSKGDLKPDQRIALRDFGSALGSDTYYGKKLAGMLWAIEKGVSS